MNKLRVRVYNVRFGDAILVTVPDSDGNGKTHIRHILIDFGNVLRGEGGIDNVFEPVIDNIIQTLDGKPLDLYIMTHEHMDHVQGLVYAAKRLNKKFDVDYAWLTASASKDYYKRGKHPGAKKKKLELAEVYTDIERFLKAAPAQEDSWIKTLMLNNNPKKTEDCVKYLRKLAKTTTYVYRGCRLEGGHPFREARFDIWAPEENTSVYYGKFHPMALNIKPPAPGGKKFIHEYPEPPAGVDAGAFYNLVERRSRGYMDNILAIDKAANNTSVVFCLEWGGWRLLFAGDAERRSWKTMEKTGVLKAVHFFKVSHHGSHTGLPPDKILDTILPKKPGDGMKRIAVVPTYPGTYRNVPDEELLEKELALRCDKLKYIVKDKEKKEGKRREKMETETVKDGGYLDFEFESRK
jgi:hypothetical protein